MPSSSPSNTPLIGNLLILALNRRGLSITEAARRIPMPRGSLQQIANGAHEPTWPTIVRILDGLDIPIEELEWREARAS